MSSKRQLPLRRWSLEDTSLPGVLRLPTEIRLQIYDLLPVGHDQSIRAESHPFCLNDISQDIQEFHIMRVCRTIRYEAIQHLFSKLYWHLSFSPRRLPHTIPSIKFTDPFIFQCLKGIKMWYFAHKCENSGLDLVGIAGHADRRDRVYLHFVNEDVKIDVDRTSCCRIKTEVDQYRDQCLKDFADDKAGRRVNMKKALLKLIHQLECHY